MKALTPTQKHIVKLVVMAWEHFEFETLRSLADQTGVSSTHAIYCTISRCIAKGYIKKSERNGHICPTTQAVHEFGQKWVESTVEVAQ